MEQSKIKIQKHIIGYKEMLKAYITELREKKISPKLQRAYIKEWKAGFWSGEKLGIDRPYEGKKDAFIVSSGDFTPRAKSALPHTGFKQPKLKPFEADPAYRDPKEPEHGKEDLRGVKQHPVKIESEPTYTDPSFTEVKSERLRRSAQILEFKIGYDHKSNAHVLYSPLKYNERWDRQSQVLWLRSIGMSPKRISIRLKIKIDTVKNWLRVFKDQPLVSCTQYDWAIRQIEGRAELSTRFSSVEAKPRAMEAINHG